MEWYWIVLVCIGYYVMWIITSILANRIGGEDCYVIAGMIWPVTLPFAIVIWFVEKYGES